MCPGGGGGGGVKGYSNFPILFVYGVYWGVMGCNRGVPGCIWVFLKRVFFLYREDKKKVLN